jgi:sec-independent protein translocase protein TatA
MSLVSGFIGSPGPVELMIIAVIVLVLFGSRLPKVMRSLGSSITEFKKGVNEGARDDSEEPAETRLETKSN